MGEQWLSLKPQQALALVPSVLHVLLQRDNQLLTARQLSFLSKVSPAVQAGSLHLKESSDWLPTCTTLFCTESTAMQSVHTSDSLCLLTKSCSCAKRSPSATRSFSVRVTASRTGNFSLQ